MNSKRPVFVLGELSDVARRVRRHISAHARALGFTHGQWRVIGRVESNPGISQIELAELLEVSPIALSRTINDMQKEGLIERRNDPVDGRIFRLYLTRAAIPTITQLYKFADELEGAALRGINKTERRLLLKLMLRMRENLLEESEKKVESKPDVSRRTALTDRRASVL